MHSTTHTCVSIYAVVGFDNDESIFINLRCTVLHHARCKIDGEPRRIKPLRLPLQYDNCSSVMLKIKIVILIIKLLPFIQSRQQGNIRLALSATFRYVFNQRIFYSYVWVKQGPPKVELMEQAGCPACRPDNSVKALSCTAVHTYSENSGETTEYIR